MQSTKLLSALLIGVGTATSAPAAAGETCSVLAGSPSQVVAVPGLAVADLNEDRAFAIPTTAVGKVSAVICDRKSAVPAEFDYKVLQAGLPFAIRSPQDTVWIEIKDGRIAVSYKEGRLSSDEASAIQAWVDRIQPRFYKDASDK